MKPILLSLACLLSISVIGSIAPALAEDPDIVATQWLDHFSYGATNTVIGLLYGGAGVAYNRIFDSGGSDSPGMHLDPTGQQIVIGGSGFSDNYSQNSGLFQFSKGSVGTGHEAGHGKNSGLLGPFHLPFQAIDYLVEGYGDHDWAESLANAYTNLGRTMVNSRPLEIRLEFLDRNGKELGRISSNFVLLERASKVRLSDSEQDPNSVNQATIRNRYLSIRAAVGSTAQCEGDSQTGVVLDASLFNRKFQSQWRAITDGLRILIDSDQDTAHLVVDVQNKRLDAKILDHQVGFGIEVEPVNGLALRAQGTARYSLGVSSSWKDQGTANLNEPSPGLLLTGGVGVRGGVRFLDILDLKGERQKEWGTGNYRHTQSSIEVNTPLLFSARTFSTLDVAPGAWTGERSNTCDQGKICPKAGPATKLYIGAKFLDSTETGNSNSGDKGTLHIQTVLFDIGGRF